MIIFIAQINLNLNIYITKYVFCVNSNLNHWHTSFTQIKNIVITQVLFESNHKWPSLTSLTCQTCRCSFQNRQGTIPACALVVGDLIHWVFGELSVRPSSYMPMRLLTLPLLSLSNLILKLSIPSTPKRSFFKAYIGASGPNLL